MAYFLTVLLLLEGFKTPTILWSLTKSPFTQRVRYLCLRLVRIFIFVRYSKKSLYSKYLTQFTQSILHQVYCSKHKTMKHKVKKCFSPYVRLVEMNESQRHSHEFSWNLKNENECLQFYQSIICLYFTNFCSPAQNSPFGFPILPKLVYGAVCCKLSYQTDQDPWKRVKMVSLFNPHKTLHRYTSIGMEKRPYNMSFINRALTGKVRVEAQ